jgi:hypothetical protein
MHCQSLAPAIRQGHEREERKVVSDKVKKHIIQEPCIAFTLLLVPKSPQPLATKLTGKFFAIVWVSSGKTLARERCAIAIVGAAPRARSNIAAAAGHARSGTHTVSNIAVVSLDSDEGHSCGECRVKDHIAREHLCLARRYLGLARAGFVQGERAG